MLSLYNLKRISRLFNKLNFRLFELIIKTAIFKYNEIIIFLILNIIILIYYRRLLKVINTSRFLYNITIIIFFTISNTIFSGFKISISINILIIKLSTI